MTFIRVTFLGVFVIAAAALVVMACYTATTDKGIPPHAIRVVEECGGFRITVKDALGLDVYSGFAMSCCRDEALAMICDKYGPRMSMVIESRPQPQPQQPPQ